MARFVAIPKFGAEIASMELPDRGFAPASRAEQVEAVRQERRRRPLHRVGEEVVELLGKEHRSPIIASPVDRTPITGVTLLEGTPDSLSDLQDALPDYDVIEDFPLALVEPTRTGDVILQKDIDAWHLDAIGLSTARSGGFQGRGAGVGVAVLDTGVAAVEELEGRISSAWKFDSEQTPEEVETFDTNGHGTHVAGLVAGKTVGVAPSADILNFVMIPHNTGTFADFLLAIEFVAQRPEISVMCMSAGFRGWKPEMRVGIQGLIGVNVLPVVAIGNEGPNTSRSPGNYVGSLSVGASNASAKIWSRSSSGTMNPDGMIYSVPSMVAPGEKVTSCLMSGGYEAWSGSSMAAPIVAGMAALMIEKNPLISEADLRDEILGACAALPGVDLVRQGAGLGRLPDDLWFVGS